MTFRTPLPAVTAGRSAHEFIQADAKRRKRLIAFVERVAADRLCLGTRCLSWSHLSTDALEDLAVDLVHDFWARKKRDRENRMFYAARGRAVEMEAV